MTLPERMMHFVLGTLMMLNTPGCTAFSIQRWLGMPLQMPPVGVAAPMSKGLYLSREQAGVGAWVG